MTINFNRSILAIATVLAGTALALPASAGTRTRLVDCGTKSCLLVTGHRADAAADVHINGHAVAAKGARNWRVRVPVETVRAWSAPQARTITVSIADNHSQANLPIGLLGHVSLASLVVRAK